MNKPQAIDTSEFNGTTNYFKAGMLFPGYYYTDGVAHVAEIASTYWLIDAILSHQVNRKVRQEAFQVWKLTVKADHTCVLLCEDGNGRKVTQQKIGFTDFPEGQQTFWLENKVLMVPSER